MGDLKALNVGMSPAFVGFIVVALVGGAAEMASAFAGARKNMLDLSVGIALGSNASIARRAINLRNARRLAQFPNQRMLASTTADNENFHSSG